MVVPRPGARPHPSVAYGPRPTGPSIHTFRGRCSWDVVGDPSISRKLQQPATARRAVAAAPKRVCRRCTSSARPHPPDRRTGQTGREGEEAADDGNPVLSPFVSTPPLSLSTKAHQSCTVPARGKPYGRPTMDVWLLLWHWRCLPSLGAFLPAACSFFVAPARVYMRCPPVLVHRRPAISLSSLPLESSIA